MKILVEVSVEFHELYGLSLNVKDIDPTYTLGELQRRRLEIIQRLKSRGLIDKNSQLPLPRPIQRIAVISSPTAAGYTDFLHQLNNNPYGFQYSVTLFPAIMQGTQTEESILSALDAIKSNFEQSEELTSVCSVGSVSKNIFVGSVQNSPNVCRDARLERPQTNDEGISNFQLVVIIRGGGATSDLQAFDSELLAERCANFPLPIITGIGHHRDETILDLVAHTALKTPTAVAEFIISQSLEVLYFLDEMAEKIQNSVTRRIEQEKNYLLLLSTRLPQFVQCTLSQYANHLTDLQHRLQLKTVDLIAKNRTYLDQKQTQLAVATNSLLQSQQSHLKLLETKLQLLDPQQLLKKGYSYTTHNGKLVTSITQLHSGDTITTTLTDGTIDSIIK
jgi:exodeoxyribonuclease VII large subunit